MAHYDGETSSGWHFTVEGWVDDAGNRTYEPPESDEHPHGLLVHATDPDDPEHDAWVWSYNPFRFDMDNLEEIEDYVDTTLAESEEIY